ncbi:hypothetical protein BS47DRAFT_1354207 [Hydnum rufescens UP504]|uniref:Uncharacterized protein n=1 Tax=Hydnum rufescens UP504 TaxID=1448309 RepID=A0A9P6AHY3_9AGAM|nr:hypothetical protein BS47DRAFT_1354207 [Hydnum rufescens UP504]
MLFSGVAATCQESSTIANFQLDPPSHFSMSTTGVTLATDLLASDPHFMCTISIRQLCTSIQNSRLERTARVISLTRFEQQRGFRHQFIVLKIGMMPDDGEAIWLRLDRGPKPENSTPRSSVSRFTPCDSATISSSEAQLLRGPRLEMKAEVVFPVDAPTAGDLRELLHILSQESPEYRLWGENCKWFCSVVQENLTHFYSGELRSGTLSHRDLGKKSRRRIADRFLSVIAPGH